MIKQDPQPLESLLIQPAGRAHRAVAESRAATKAKQDDAVTAFDRSFRGLLALGCAAVVADIITVYVVVACFGLKPVAHPWPAVSLCGLAIITLNHAIVSHLSSAKRSQRLVFRAVAVVTAASMIGGAFLWTTSEVDRVAAIREASIVPPAKVRLDHFGVVTIDNMPVAPAELRTRLLSILDSGREMWVYVERNPDSGGSYDRSLATINDVCLHGQAVFALLPDYSDVAGYRRMTRTRR